MRVPNISWKIRKGPDWWDESAEDYFKGKRVLIVSLPGAFTPTCSTQQLPNLEELYDQYKEYGIDEVYCLSVNDSFVINAWAESLKIEKVQMIPDGSGEFTRDMDMLVWKPGQNFGYRSWRYAMIVDDMEVEKMFVEEGKNQTGHDNDPYKVTIPENILTYLKVLNPKIVPIPTVTVSETTNEDLSSLTRGRTSADNITGPY